MAMELRVKYGALILTESALSYPVHLTLETHGVRLLSSCCSRKLSKSLKNHLEALCDDCGTTSQYSTALRRGVTHKRGFFVEWGDPELAEKVAVWFRESGAELLPSHLLALTVCSLAQHDVVTARQARGVAGLRDLSAMLTDLALVG